MHALKSFPSAYLLLQANLNTKTPIYINITVHCTTFISCTFIACYRDSLEILLIREVLRCNKVVMTDVYSVSSITAKLVADGVLSEEEQTTILAQESDAGQNDKLLHYISHKFPDTFYSFCRNVHSESEKGAKVVQYLAQELHSLDTSIAFADKVCKHACMLDPYVLHEKYMFTM